MRVQRAAARGLSSAPATLPWSSGLKENTMGHKVHPTGIRLGIAKDWNSKWFAGKKDFANYLLADLKVRVLLREKLAQAGISRIQIERPAKNARVTIHTARPG